MHCTLQGSVLGSAFMVHQFHQRALIQSGNGLGFGTRITTFGVDTALGPSPQLRVPERITGKVVSNFTPQLHRKLSRHDSEVGFEGRRYGIRKIEADGTLDLYILTPPY